MKEHVVAAQMYTVREFCQDLEGVKTSMEKVAKIGYTAVQVSGFGDVSAKDVAKIAADNGLTIASSHMNWERFMTDLDGIIEEHQIWNCTHPAIGGIFRGYEGAEGVKRFLDDLAPIAEKLASVGMDFSYHNHSHEFAKYGGKTWFQMMVDQSTPEQLKLEIDTYWVQHGGADPVYWIRYCGKRQPCYTSRTWSSRRSASSVSARSAKATSTGRRSLRRLRRSTWNGTLWSRTAAMSAIPLNRWRSAIAT